MSEARELLKRAVSALHDTFDGVKYIEPLITEQEILDCAEKTWHKFDLDNDVNIKGLVNIVREIEKTHGIK